MTARVIALVEGPTEEKFVRELLAPAFWSLDVSIIPTTYGHPRRQGGVPAWGKAQRELVGLLKQDTGRHVTTMFDYYGMPLDWPGRDMAPEKPHEERGDLVEEQMRGRIAASLQSELAANRFIPYVQMHELEALFFSDPESLGDVLARDARPQRIQRQLQRIADAFATPEQIDDDPATAPSKRIRALAPDYQKVTDGNIAARRIGLRAMRRKCPHFDKWVCRLEALGK